MDLFEDDPVPPAAPAASPAVDPSAPLAERMRPRTIDDIVGQEALLGPGRPLREAILQLKDQQRTVLSLYYFEELNAREIADVLGISESRVSQIRSKALSQLRCIMRPMRASA